MQECTWLAHIPLSITCLQLWGEREGGKLGRRVSGYAPASPEGSPMGSPMHGGVVLCTPWQGRGAQDRQ